MVSSQGRHRGVGFDEVIQESDADFAESGLKEPSVIRVGRLAVVEGETIAGAIGQVAFVGFKISRAVWPSGLWGRSNQAVAVGRPTSCCRGRS